MVRGWKEARSCCKSEVDGREEATTGGPDEKVTSEGSFDFLLPFFFLDGGWAGGGVTGKAVAGTVGVGVVTRTGEVRLSRGRFLEGRGSVREVRDGCEDRAGVEVNSESESMVS